MNIGVLLAAGMGIRFDEDRPKQFSMLNGKETISYTIESFKKTANMDDFIVMLDPKEVEDGRIAREYGVKTVAGGNSRAESFDNALKYIAENNPSCKNVIFHEAARPLVKEDTFELYFEFLKEYDYVTSCKHITDSLGSYLPEVPNREDFYLIQAPEAYRFELINKYFDVESPYYFASFQLPKDSKGKLYYDIKNNHKLTYQEDVRIIEMLLNN